MAVTARNTKKVVLEVVRVDARPHRVEQTFKTFKLKHLLRERGGRAVCQRWGGAFDVHWLYLGGDSSEGEEVILEVARVDARPHRVEHGHSRRKLAPAPLPE